MPAHPLAALLLALACLQAQAQIVACPQRLSVLNQRGELINAHLFIGLPEKNNELKRSGKQRRWVLAKLHQRAAAAKQGLYLQCRYRGMQASLTIAVQPSAAACVIGSNSAGMTIGCK